MSWGERSCAHKGTCPMPPGGCKIETCNVDCRLYVWDGTTQPDSMPRQPYTPPVPKAKAKRGKSKRPRWMSKNEWMRLRDRQAKKTFLECMFNDLNDITDGSDEQVEQELEEMGIDVDKAHESFERTIEQAKREAKDERTLTKRVE